jgi:hypothetical protein
MRRACRTLPVFSQPARERVIHAYLPADTVALTKATVRVHVKAFRWRIEPQRALVLLTREQTAKPWAAHQLPVRQPSPLGLIWPSLPSAMD